MTDATCVLLPVQLSAFALSPKCCDASNYYSIAPITQPNHTFLRLDDNLLAADILDHVDLHSVSPARLNSRVTDLGLGAERTRRLGVYLHWTLPYFYRLGTSVAEGSVTNAQQRSQAATEQVQRKVQAGYPSSSCNPPTASSDLSIPDFRPIPNRWMITRRIDVNSIQPQSARPFFATKPFQSWIIQSNALRNVNKLATQTDLDAEVDLEVDVSPGIDPSDYASVTNDRIIAGPAEIFLGRKTAAESWDWQLADQDPGVHLNVMTTSNPLFTDYQPHNSNVLSTVDNFSYQDQSGKTKYLTFARADYSVVGWHANDDDDPFTTANGQVVPHSVRMDKLKTTLKDPTYGLATTWPSTASHSRTVCHGSMYDVVYDYNNQPNNVPANDCGKAYHQPQPPLAVGVSAMDALLSYCKAHAHDSQDDALQRLVKDLTQIQALIAQTEVDDVDGLQAAVDEQLAEGFSKTDGGTTWHFGDQTTQNQPNVSATPAVNQALSILNQLQASIDGTTREIDTNRWKMFAEWWIGVSDFSKNVGDWNAKVAAIYKRIGQLSDASNGRFIDLLRQFLGLVDSFRQATDVNKGVKWNGDVTKIPPMPSSLNKTATERFYQRNDPTLFLGNVAPAFESDFSDTLQIRLQDQTIRLATGEKMNSAGWDGYDSQVSLLISKLPPLLSTGVRNVLQEFYALRSSTTLTTAAQGQTLPWFHDEASRHETRGRDRWNNTQPWKPLMVEWEADYFHIPYEKWNFDLYPSVYQGSTVHYKVNDYVAGMPNLERRSLSGRNILTPQSQATLATTIKNLFLNMPKEEIQSLNLDQTKILADVSAANTATAQLSGLTAHLLTTNEGPHFKPLARQPNSTPNYIPEAGNALSRIFDPSITKGSLGDVFKLIDGSSSSTPYGSSVAASLYQLPVTHGQLLFTKINIIDRFGQAVPLINPLPQIQDDAASICPVISDSLWIGTVKDPQSSSVIPNCAIRQNNPMSCPFVALPPAINQPARMNASFVRKVPSSVAGVFQWRIASDWENPVFGWLIMNYADNGLQIFKANGQFYREVRLGGRNATNASAAWLPFSPPSTATVDDEDLEQLQDFVNLLGTKGDSSYLRGIMDMINQAYGDDILPDASLPHAPDTYAAFSSAIVGKPLALCYAGWSLELANEPAMNWSTYNPDTTSPKRTLVKPIANDPVHWSQWSVSDTSGANAPGYSFQVKLGDKDRLFDGMVGYFPLSATALTAKKASMLDYTKLYTSFLPDQLDRTQAAYKMDPRIAINASNYPRLTPYYASPGLPGEPAFDHASKLNVFGLLLDPFVPVHAYTAILPNRKLQLPPWILEQALKQMTAFFHCGPVLTSQDVRPTFDPTAKLDGDYSTSAVILPQSSAPAVQPLDPAQAISHGTNASPVPTTPSAAAIAASSPPSVRIPLSPPAASSSGASAEYRFLQPYVVASTDANGKAITTTEFNAFNIAGNASMGTDVLRANLDPGPYTALEGYIQLVKPAASS